MLRFSKKRAKSATIKDAFKQLEQMDKRMSELSEKMAQMKKDAQFSVQKVGLIKYNPFSGIGGNQSFSLALLDGQDNGVVFTSLYGRDGTRIYTKPIVTGSADIPLSEEEKQVLQQALQRSES